MFHFLNNPHTTLELCNPTGHLTPPKRGLYPVRLDISATNPTPSFPPPVVELPFFLAVQNTRGGVSEMHGHPSVALRETIIAEWGRITVRKTCQVIVISPMPYGSLLYLSFAASLSTPEITVFVTTWSLPRRASIVRVQPPDVSPSTRVVHPRFETWGGTSPGSPAHRGHLCEREGGGAFVLVFVH